mmetsp:Transcript_89999/g.278367  ORF Transcript_89999/g.278367 Transcript_89999/m.278367 type:complete len:204 (-) Transcript_89999:92-703(-)
MFTKAPSLSCSSTSSQSFALAAVSILSFDPRMVWRASPTDGFSRPSPWLSRRLGLAPCRIISSTRSTELPITAHIKGVQPSSSLSSTFAPACRSAHASSESPRFTASRSIALSSATAAIMDLIFSCSCAWSMMVKPAWSCTSKLMPQLKMASTMPKWPWRAAHMHALRPSLSVTRKLPLAPIRAVATSSWPWMEDHMRAVQPL